MKLDLERLDALKDSALDGGEVHRKVKSWLASVSVVGAPDLLVTLVEEESLADNIKLTIIGMMSHSHPSHQTIRFLRQLVHDKSLAKEFRAQALYSMVSICPDLLHVDLMALLADSSEEPWMRAEAAAALGSSGCDVENAEALIMAILAQDEVHEEIAFWCIYTCTCFENKDALILLLGQYLNDHRVVEPPISRDLMSCPATVSMEASWAIDCLSGVTGEPEWERAG